MHDTTPLILAGGLGSRLRPVVADRPKVMATVHERPFLTYLLDQLADASFPRVVLLTGYRAEQVRKFLGNTYRGMELVHSPEPAPLGTGGAVRAGLSHVETDTLLVLNGDSFCQLDLRAYGEAHRRQNADLSLALAHVENASRFGRVEIDADDRVREFHEKQPRPEAGWINAGLYLIRRELIEAIPADRPISLERDRIPAWLRWHRVAGFRATGAFLDIGTPDSYAAAAAFFAA